MYCVTQAERALVCARQTVGQHCNVRERAKANKNQSSASREIESNPVRLVDLNTKKICTWCSKYEHIHTNDDKWKSIYRTQMSTILCVWYVCVCVCCAGLEPLKSIKNLIPQALCKLPVNTQWLVQSHVAAVCCSTAMFCWHSGAVVIVGLCCDWLSSEPWRDLAISPWIAATFREITPEMRQHFWKVGKCGHIKNWFSGTPEAQKLHTLASAYFLGWRI